MPQHCEGWLRFDNMVIGMIPRLFHVWGFGLEVPINMVTTLTRSHTTYHTSTLVHSSASGSKSLHSNPVDSRNRVSPVVIGAFG